MSIFAGSGTPAALLSLLRQPAPRFPSSRPDKERVPGTSSPSPGCEFTGNAGSMARDLTDKVTERHPAAHSH